MGAGKLRVAVQEGDVDLGSFMAGQSAGLVKKCEPAASIIEDMISGAREQARIIEGFIK